MRYLIIGILFLQIACSSSAQERQVKAERKPFQKSSVEIKSPTTYSKRETEKGEYDPRPRVVLIDEKAGKYELRWIGYDGKQKIVKYQRNDALDALVEARIEKTSEGKFVYKYLIKNLPTSPAYLSGFTVQTLASDVKDEAPLVVNDIFIGNMAKFIPDFSDGTWRYFSPLGEKLPKVEAGKSIEFSLVSSALPGIVGCRATGGDLTLKGVGEHMPSELERAMPGYEEEAKGYTIGPIDRLATLNKSERAKYILENLPKFQESGWMSEGTAKIYESILKREDLAGAFKQAKKDLENEFITGEVYYIIEGLNQ
ncbi:MAG: hypothetical protein ACR2MG_21200 [Pyrinomonadaceae bacterium]